MTNVKRISVQKRPSPASSGAYGARPFNPVESNANALLEDIERELADVDFFSREDLLHLSTFQFVATITRYRYVGDAVNYLLERGKLLAKSRTEMCLPGRAKRYRGPDELVNEFSGTVLRLARKELAQYETVSVGDIIDAWETDHHLAENSKRVIARRICRALVREGELLAVSPGVFAAPEKGGGR